MRSLYRFFAHEGYHQLRWDVGRLGRRSGRKVRSWRGTGAGRKAVILCNGPSLLDTPFHLLADTFTFGLNKVHLLTERNGFVPSAVVAVNPFVIEQCREVYRASTLPLFLDTCARALIPERSNVHYLRATAAVCFSQRPDRFICQGYTVTYVALQLAWFMGFDEVALVGCDHDFAARGRPNEVQQADGPDRSHFDPRYFSGGVSWNLPDLAASEWFYNQAREAFEGSGRRIVNCTRGGRLEVFERSTLADFLGRGRD